MWKLFGAALFVNAIITIYLHRAGRLVIYKNYTDITFTGLAPLAGIIIFFVLHFFEVPIEISRTVAFIVFACLVFLIAKSTYRNNGLSFFLMSLVTKLTIVIVYYAIMAFLIFGSGSARKKGERASTYEARKRREAKVNTAAMAAATVGFIGLSAWVCKDPEFVPLKEYLFQAKAA